jgi:hypothetical protein
MNMRKCFEWIDFKNLKGGLYGFLHALYMMGSIALIDKRCWPFSKIISRKWESCINNITRSSI